MNRSEFMAVLRSRLVGLPAADIEERLEFYGEAIDDRMEEGLTESEAVAAIGPIDDIVRQTKGDIPPINDRRENIRPKQKPKALVIVLLAVGSPLWLSLAIAAFAALLAVYIALWSLVISVWAIFASLAAFAVFGLIFGAADIIASGGLAAMAYIGMGILSAGLAIFSFHAAVLSVKGTLGLTRISALGIKKCFVRKETAK